MKTNSSVLLTIMAVFFFLCSPCIVFSAQVNIFGVTITPSVAPKAGVPLTVTVNASSTDGSPVHYKFYYCANYGTSAYAITPWTLVQDYSTDNTCNYTFPSVGDYIVVVWAVTDPHNEPDALPIVGQTVTVTLDNPPAGSCGAFVAPGVWKEFDCYNLAAIGKITNDDPFTPSWRLIGGYWQWGRKGPDTSQWYNTNTSNFAHGPTGPDPGSANDGAISGWDTTDAPDGSWSDTTKTANDPCPAGFRVPTMNQWEGVLYNNSQSTVGAWSATWDDHTNYSAARFFGNGLMLPAAGYHHYYSGELGNRGDIGYYWSSTQYSSPLAWNLSFSSSTADTRYDNRTNGFSVRCVAE